MSYDYVITIYCLHMITYWFFSMMFYFVDLAYLNKNHNNWKNYGKGAIISLFNQVFVSAPTIFLLNDYVNNAIDKSKDDTMTTTIIKVFAISNISNIIFYFIHYLLHKPYFYKMIHSKHHEFIDPIAVAALYAHPIEHLFGNILAFIVPQLIIGINYTTTMILVFIGTLITLIAHFDYNILGIKNGHAIHHRKFLCNYGFGDYLDKFFGTYKE